MAEVELVVPPPVVIEEPAVITILDDSEDMVIPDLERACDLVMGAAKDYLPDATDAHAQLTSLCHTVLDAARIYHKRPRTQEGDAEEPAAKRPRVEPA
jgi:hypothetical protein